MGQDEACSAAAGTTGDGDGQGARPAGLGANWGNGAGGAGAVASEAQMAAFNESLERAGLELQDCPGVDNHCGYFAVLSQVSHSWQRCSVVRQTCTALVLVEGAWLLGVKPRTLHASPWPLL